MIMNVSSVGYRTAGQPIQISPNLGVTHLKGTAREVGIQYGLAFGQDLVDFESTAHDLIKQSAGLFRGFIAWHVLLPVYARLQWGKISAPLQDELLGIAEGAQQLGRSERLRNKKMRRLSAFYDFSINMALTGQGCAFFAVRNAARKLLIGRNFDINFDALRTLERSQILIYDIEGVEGQRPFISMGPVFFNAAPITSIIRGENGDPIFFALHNALGPTRFLGLGLPTVELARQATQQPDFESLRQLLEDTTDTCAKKIVVASPDQALVADFVPGVRTFIQELEEGERALAATNHYQVEGAEEYETEEEAEHGWSLNSQIRLHRIYEALEKTPATVQGALQVLAPAVDFGEDPISPPFDNDFRWPTSANLNLTYGSYMVDPETGMLWVGAGPFAPHSDMYGFEIAELFNFTRAGQGLLVERHNQDHDEKKLEAMMDFNVKLREARDLHRQGKLAEAQKLIRPLLDINQDHVRVQLLNGAIELERFGPSDQCLECFRNVLDIEMDKQVPLEEQRGSALAHLLSGLAHDLQGKRELALIDYALTVELEETNAFGRKAAEMARRFLASPCRRLPSHKRLAYLFL
ncbi:MAG: hypothetical protein ABH823_00265 [bacterium]